MRVLLIASGLERDYLRQALSHHDVVGVETGVAAAGAAAEVDFDLVVGEPGSFELVVASSARYATRYVFLLEPGQVPPNLPGRSIVLLRPVDARCLRAVVRVAPRYLGHAN